MDTDEFQTLVALIWGHHGGQTRAASHFGVAPRTVRRWIAGDRKVPDSVADELRRLAERAPMPPIAPPPPGTTPDDDRDDSCAAAIEPAYVALMLRAEQAGWTAPEALTALLSWIITDMRNGAGDQSTRNTLTAALMMLD